MIQWIIKNQKYNAAYLANANKAAAKAAANLPGATPPGW